MRSYLNCQRAEAAQVSTQSGSDGPGLNQLPRLSQGPSLPLWVLTDAASHNAQVLPIGSMKLACIALRGLLGLWLLCGAVQAQTSQNTQVTTAPQRRGELAGRVVDAAGRGVAGATVRAFAATRREGAAPAVTTGLDGRFRFSDLAANVYRLSAGAPGYVQPMDEFTRNMRYRLGADATLSLVKGSVITGKIIDVRGAPVVGVRVRALPMNDENAVTGYEETDDRGLYRIYGLRAGNYVVVVGGASGLFGEPNGTEPFLIVYHPSTTTIDTAKVIAVAPESETDGVDITYQTVPGRTVSGKLTDAAINQTGYNITLTAWPDAATRYYTSVNGSEASSKAFALKGLSDGEYLLTAQTNNYTGGPVALATRRVTVQGADVTGLELALTPLAALSGRVVNAPAAWPTLCQTRPALVWDEIGLKLQRYAANPNEVPKAEPFTRAETAVDGRGTFSAINLSGGKYLLQWQLPVAEWYLQSISGPTVKPDAKPSAPIAANVAANNAPPQLITLANGAETKGITLTFAPGAASLRGRVVAAPDATLPPLLRVYLLPAEPENAANFLRYNEIAVAADGSFQAQNLAPGRYWLLAQPVKTEKAAALFYDAAERAKLRRAAETAKNVLDLSPCQKLADYELSPQMNAETHR